MMSNQSTTSHSRIVSCDAGATTGVCVYEAGVFTTHVLDNIRDFAKFLEPKPALVIVEASPLFGNPAQLERVSQVIFLCDVRDVPVRLVSPGNWKPVAKAQGWKLSNVTQHEQDAYCMIRHYLLGGEI